MQPMSSTRAVGLSSSAAPSLAMPARWLRIVAFVPERYQYTEYKTSGGTVYSIWRSPQAFSSSSGLQRTSEVGTRRSGGTCRPGLKNDPCKCCSPRSMTFVSAEDLQTRQVVR